MSGLIVVSGVLANSQGGILMQLRKPAAKRPNLWELPGGKVDPGEEPVAALVREWHEELGVDVVGAVPIHSHIHTWDITFEVIVFAIDQIVGIPRPLDAMRLSYPHPREALDWLPCNPIFYPAYSAIVDVVRSRLFL